MSDCGFLVLSGRPFRLRRALVAVVILVAFCIPGVHAAPGDSPAELDLGVIALRYGPRIMVSASLLAWGLLAPDQFGDTTIDILPGEPADLNEAIDRAGTVALLLTMGTSTAGRLVSDWPNAIDSLSVSSAVIASAYASRSYLKALFRRTRPSAVAQGFFTDTDDRQSFPSGHTLLAWACVGDALVGAVRRTVDPWVLATVTVEAVAVACLRVAAGEHYPGDVVAGAAIGLAVGSLVSLALLPL
jgi:membrane-associated phospholipid phosphatase